MASHADSLRKASRNWFAGLVMGVCGGFLVLIFPTLGLLLMGLGLAGVLGARPRDAGVSGLLTGIGATIVVLLVRAEAACQAFDAAPNQGCEAPDLTAFMVVAGGLCMVGAVGSVIALRRGQK